MPGRRRRSQLVARIALVILGGLSAAASTAYAYSREAFPEIRPQTRDQAIGLLRSEAHTDALCLTSRIQSISRTPFGEAPVVRRAVALLQSRATLAREQVAPGPGGIAVRYTAAPDAYDRINPADADADGRPDVLQAALEGLERARHVFVDRLGLPAPTDLEVLLVRLDDPINGYVAPAGDRTGRTVLVLDASPRRGVGAVRRAAIHHYAHAIAPGLPPAWGEALATWSELEANGGIGPRTLSRMARRLQALSSGLLDDDLSLAAGNSIWLAFLEEAYGLATVRLTVEELASGGPVAAAFDRALRRSGTDDLATAFREFHLWSVLIGDRADEHHLSFAGRLASMSFASSVEGLPALSVQADPALAPLGAAQVRLTPMATRGGLRVHFEGEFAASWEADLLLFDEGGRVRRLALELIDSRGEITVPVADVAEAVLLVRNLGSDDGESHRYTYSAQREKDFPFVIVSAGATPTDATRPGVLVSWETASEQQLLAYNVVRSRADSGSSASSPSRLTVNPIWIPALGDPARSTGYRFLDHSAEPGVSYIYRIEGITRDGLTSLSDPFIVAPAPPAE